MFRAFSSFVLFCFFKEIYSLKMIESPEGHISDTNVKQLKDE
jgi:hypothetical protein